jgi:hypothetical protein
MLLDSQSLLEQFVCNFTVCGHTPLALHVLSHTRCVLHRVAACWTWSTHTGRRSSFTDSLTRWSPLPASPLEIPEPGREIESKRTVTALQVRGLLSGAFLVMPASPTSATDRLMALDQMCSGESELTQTRTGRRFFQNCKHVSPVFVTFCRLG